MLLTDDLIDRLHRLRIEGMVSFSESVRAVLTSGDGAAIGSGFAVFAGAGSPMTQVYGVGFRGTSINLSEIDEFYAGRTDNWELILTPFVDPSEFQRAVAWGYVPDHFESVLAQISGGGLVEGLPDVTLEEIGHDLTEWMCTSEMGWTGADALPDGPSEITRLICATNDVRRYLARVNGVPAATASLGARTEGYLFAGASTLPKFRGRGLQRLLSQRRLADATPGSVVTVTALPGSKSHRNLQRVGFQPLYSKMVFYRRPSG
jgi:hypothetical protein